MSVLANQITIAVTVYSRREFISQAVRSALNQSAPARVIVVEDCGPDPGLESFVKNEFGSSITYTRNPRCRGLFGNWNACLELCETEWITILHDDDYLAPNFTRAMGELAAESPGHHLYLGRTIMVEENGEVAAAEYQDGRAVPGRWVERGLRDILFEPFIFAGHLFHVPTAKQLGGFRAASYMAGDWEMWARLMAVGGAAQTSETVAFYRGHRGWDRGSNRAAREGRHLPSMFVCHKRILRLFPPGQRIQFDRKALQRRAPLSARYLLQWGGSMSSRLFRYHVGLLLLSPPPHWRYALFQLLARLGGVRFVKTVSQLWFRRYENRDGH
jgi:hypothetical protein